MGTVIGNGFHPVPPFANLEEHSRTPLPRLRVLRRRRAVLAVVCAVAATVSGALVAVAPLLALTVVALLGVIAGTVVNCVLSAASVARLTKEIRAREYEARFALPAAGGVTGRVRPRI